MNLVSSGRKGDGTREPYPKNSFDSDNVAIGLLPLEIRLERWSARIEKCHPARAAHRCGVALVQLREIPCGNLHCQSLVHETVGHYTPNMSEASATGPRMWLKDIFVIRRYAAYATTESRNARNAILT